MLKGPVAESTGKSAAAPQQPVLLPQAVDRLGVPQEAAAVQKRRASTAPADCACAGSLDSASAAAEAKNGDQYLALVLTIKVTLLPCQSGQRHEQYGSDGTKRGRISASK